MNAGVLRETIAVGAITGMRSMAGPALLARRHGRAVTGVVWLMAAGEMIADKTALVGDRTEALPLTGRALMGALVGGSVARRHGANVMLGVAIGAATATMVAHVACWMRKRLPVSTALGGALEDAVVIGLGAIVGGGAIAPAAAVYSA